MMMKMNKRRKKSGMSMDKGMKYAKSSKKGMEGDDMLSMDSMPVKKAMGGMMRPPTAAQVKPTSMPPSRMPTSPTQVKPRSPLMKAEGGMVSPRKKMAMGYADGGMVQSRGNGAARGKKTRIC